MCGDILPLPIGLGWHNGLSLPARSAHHCDEADKAGFVLAMVIQDIGAPHYQNR